MSEIAPYPYDKIYGCTPDGRVWRIGVAHNYNNVPWEKKQRLTSRGYLKVKLRCGTMLVHRMIAETFLPNPERLPEVAHKNGIKTDNRVENLRWSTEVENAADRIEHGTHPGGENNPRAILDEQDVLFIRRYPRTYGSQLVLAAKFGVSISTISSVRSGRAWAHV